MYQRRHTLIHPSIPYDPLIATKIRPSDQVTWIKLPMIQFKDPICLVLFPLRHICPLLLCTNFILPWPFSTALLNPSDQLQHPHSLPTKALCRATHEKGAFLLTSTSVFLSRSFSALTKHPLSFLLTLPPLPDSTRTPTLILLPLAMARIISLVPPRASLVARKIQSMLVFPS